MNQRFKDLILAAIKQRLSDIHITGGFPLIFRRDGIIHFDKNIKWSHTEIDSMVKEMLSDRQLLTLRKRWSVDFSLSFNQVRARVNTFYTTRGLSMAIRLLPETIPDLNSLNLHPSLAQITKLQSGLVLVCGSTGSGKSTTVAAIIEEINRTIPAHIVTIEDPIEYVYEDQKSFINQREIGLDVESFPHALRAVLRQDPDVILIGEMRDQETFGTALKAAETGHLVFGTLHSSTVVQTFGRIYDIFPAEERESIRKALMFNLIAVIGQKLAPTKDNLGRIPIHEIMIMNATIQKLIEEKKEGKIGELIRTLEGEGMCDFNQSLYKAIKDGYITDKVALSMSHNPEQLKMNLKGIFVSDSGILA